jgi:hypothetical protein
MVKVVIETAVMIVPEKRTANQDNDSGNHDCHEYAHDFLLYKLKCFRPLIIPLLV